MADNGFHHGDTENGKNKNKNKNEKMALLGVVTFLRGAAVALAR